MSNINPLQRPGSKLFGVDVNELFLIEFGGLVLNAFKAKTKFLDKHTLQTITHGRGTRIDALGEADAMYHTPGTDLSTFGKRIKHDSFDILVDAKLISHLYVDETEDNMNHFELKNRYAEKLGTAIAKQLDANIARKTVLAARHATRIPDSFGGTVLSAAAMKTDVDVLTASLFDAQVMMDNKDVPEDARFCYLRPTYYSMLAQNLNLINSLYRGQGSIAEGEIIKVAGFTLVKSNSVPNSVVTGTFNSKYDGDFGKTVAICSTTEAVATVQLRGLTTEAHWDFNRQAWFLAAKIVLGHDVMRPECAIELATA